MKDTLEEYRRKRDVSRTREPAGEPVEETGERGEGDGIFVVQKHAASRLHYDFRLESRGVLKSWAVPRGPSYSTSDRRLAVEVEDHPLEYARFEGVIPEGEYGAGRVILWDRGHYRLAAGGDDGAPASFQEALEEGLLVFTLCGQKLRGRWALIRTAFQGDERNWLLVKKKDAYAGAVEDIVEEQPLSVVSGRALEDL